MARKDDQAELELVDVAYAVRRQGEGSRRRATPAPAHGEDVVGGSQHDDQRVRQQQRPDEGQASSSSSGGTRKASVGDGFGKGSTSSSSAAAVLPLPVLESSARSSPYPASPSPLPRRRILRPLARVLRFLQGPSPPRALPKIGDGLSLALTVPSGRRTVNPDAWFARVYLARFRRVFPPSSVWHGVLLGSFLLVGWLIGFAFLVRANSFLSDTRPSAGGGVQFLGCTDTFASANDGCGLDFADCASSGNITFRCPAGCAAQLIYNQRAVGNLEPVMVPFVIGTDTYRADSFICSAFVHSGLISNRRGGCGIATLRENVTSFAGTSRAGITSLSFPTIFPLAFEFADVGSVHCEDLRWQILGFNVAMGVVLSLLLDPGPLVMFWTLLCMSYWHVVLVSDPRAYPPVISDAFKDFLPALFAGYYFWRVAFRFTLPAFQAHALERTLWYLAPLWAGILLNVITDNVVQFDRLTGSDISGKAVGTFAALIVIIVLFAGLQISVAWRTGWLPFYLKWTVAGALVIVVLSQLPDLTFRLHHYAFSLLFMPALGFATRVSAVLQALLLGIFSNGIGKWGWESVLQTPDELRRDGALGSALPALVTNASNWGGLSGETFNQAVLRWAPVPEDLAGQWNGFSVLVDDVERYTGTATNLSLAAFDSSLPHFFRIAYQLDGTSGDYIKAATFWPNGTWVDPLPGPS